MYHVQFLESVLFSIICNDDKYFDINKYFESIYSICEEKISLIYLFIDKNNNYI